MYYILRIKDTKIKHSLIRISPESLSTWSPLLKPFIPNYFVPVFCTFAQHVRHENRRKRTLKTITQKEYFFFLKDETYRDMENTATVPTGLDVSRLLKSQSLSASMRTNLARADIDNDGIIDVEELVKILESESALRRERKLLHWIVVALGIACILIVVAVVGLTYAVVHLSKDTTVHNNVLVSKADSQPLSTGSLQVSSTLKDLYKVDNLAQLQGLDQIMMPFEDGISLFGIEGVHLVPGKSVRFDTNRENLTILVTEDGISVSGGSSNSTGRRRLLDE